MKSELLKLLMFVSKTTCYLLILQLAGLQLLLANDTKGQPLKDITVTIHVNDATPVEIFEAIERQTDLRFVHSQSISKIKETLDLDYDNKPLKLVLLQVSKEAGLTFKKVRRTISVIKSPNKREPPPDGAAAGVSEALQPDRTISGKVTDENGEPLAGATIQVKGRLQIGAVTDIEGNFVLSIPDDAITLIFTYVGFLSQEVDVTSSSVVEVMLQPDLRALEEVQVVSTGYYEIQQRQNPGNIAKIDSEIIERQPVVNPLEALQGQVAGVFIQQTSGLPGAPININIRGLNSLNNGQTLRGSDGTPVRLPNSNLPFFVIDGVPYTSSSLNSDQFTLSGGNPLAAFRPGDIESIEVLKDADATAIYGSRGANGVVLITTKKGQSGKLKLDLDFSRGIGEVPNRVDLMNTNQYLAMRRESWQNDRFVPMDANDTLVNSDLLLWGENRDVDWQEELVGGTAEQTNASMTLSGGNASTKFLFRGSYFRQTNVFNYDNSAFESASGHLNLNHSSRDNRFNINLSITYTSNTNDQIGLNFMTEALILAPNGPVLFDENGQINFADNFDNPLADLERDYQNKTNALVTNVSFRYELLPGLDFKSALGYTNSTVNEISIIPLASFTPEEREFNTGRSSIASGNEDTWIIEPQLTFTKELGKGVFNAILGSTFQGSTRERRTIEGTGYESDLLIRDIGQAPGLNILNNSFTDFRYTALYTRLNYVWDDKYVLNLTGRRDGSSRFGPDRQFGNFGAVGAAWIFSEESFLNNNTSFLSFGKLRGSYGITGNDQVGDYGFLDSYGAPQTITNTYNGNTGLVAVRAANPEFSWESNKKLELGLELGFLQGRFNISTSWFRNRSDNQLIGRPLSAVTGFSTIQFNLPALVENRGIEIELNTINFDSEEFTWSTAFNFTRARNQLLEFPNIQEFTPFNNRYVVGRSTFGAKEYQSLGVDPLTGNYAIVDVNGDGRIGIDDRQDFVEIFQDYFGGLTNSFTWKGFQLDVFVRFVKQNGREFRTISLTPGQVFIGRGGNHPAEILDDRWQSPGDVTSIQKFTQFDFTASRNEPLHDTSNRTVVDASFIRLQNVSLSYTLPEKWTSRLQLNGARLYINGQNLYTWTPYDGLDPESQGTRLPPLRMITTGIQLTF